MGIDLPYKTAHHQLEHGGRMDRLVIKSEEHDQELSGIGARESEVDMKDTIPQHIDNKGTKVEDLAGTGEGDSPGG